MSSLRKRLKSTAFLCLSVSLVASLLLLASPLFISRSGNLGASPAEVPFAAGEKLVYRAKWAFVPAGEAIIEVLPFETINGAKSYHFVMKTNTNARMDRVYRICERQDSYTDVEMTRTIGYTKQNTGKYPRDVSVNFDWVKRTATYVNFGRPEKAVAIMPGTFDPLALFFVIRMNKLNPGDVIEIPITDGKMCIVAKATVAGSETITIGGKPYETRVVIPDIERLERVVKKAGKPRLKIWFTADGKRVPVKFQSQVAVGAFVFELVSAKYR